MSCNANWCANFPNTMIYHLPMMKSDHAPILAILDSNRPRPRKSFKFENWWLLEKDFNQVVQQSWTKSSSRPFHHKISYLTADLKTWCKSKPRLSDQLHTTEQQLLNHQMCHPSQHNHFIQNELIFQHQTILAKQEEYHRQRYKKKWYVLEILLFP